MDRTRQQWTIKEGTDVVGSEGDKVGEVIAVQDEYIVVEKGFFFPSDYYIPTSAIGNISGDKIYLNVTKDQALDQGWDTEPATTTTGTYATGTTTDVVDRNPDYDRERAVDYGAERDLEPRARTVRDDETIEIPVREEELTARRRPVERGEVEVEKDVVAEQQTLDVPVTEERVRVQRRAVDREVPADEAAFEEGEIDVPVRGEEVVPEKRARVTEEVEISKEPVERTERVTDTVRREEIDVEGEKADRDRR